MPVMVVVATILCLLKLTTTFLRLATMLTVAVNCLLELLLGPVDAFAAIVIGGLRPWHSSSNHRDS
jgi:hypothetical protein